MKDVSISFAAVAAMLILPFVSASAAGARSAGRVATAMKIGKTKTFAAAMAVMIAVATAGADVVKSLAGAWRVTGENLSGEVHLPGTLADAKLGRRMTAADWETDTDRRSKGALTREYQYVGKAVYEREITLTSSRSRAHPKRPRRGGLTRSVGCATRTV